MSAMESQITSLTIVYSTVYSGANQRKHQSSASLAFVRGIHRWPVNSPHKGLVTRKMCAFDDVIMKSRLVGEIWLIESYVAAMLRITPATAIVVNINACSRDSLFIHAYYRQTSNIVRTISQNLNVSRLVLKLSLPNQLTPFVRSRMKMQLEQRWWAMLQHHLNDQQFYCLLRCGLYHMFDDTKMVATHHKFKFVLLWLPPTMFFFVVLWWISKWSSEAAR